jgi:hypothetical protein
MYLSMYLTIAVSIDVQNCHDYNAFQLPNSTAQYEVIDMSHYHDSCSRFLLICSLMGCKGSLCDVDRGVYGLVKGQQSPELHMEPGVYRQILVIILLLLILITMRNASAHDKVLCLPQPTQHTIGIPYCPEIYILQDSRRGTLVLENAFRQMPGWNS